MFASALKVQQQEQVPMHRSYHGKADKSDDLELSQHKHAQHGHGQQGQDVVYDQLVVDDEELREIIGRGWKVRGMRVLRLAPVCCHTTHQT